MNSLQAIAIKTASRLFFRYYPKNIHDTLRHCRKVWDNLPVPKLLPFEVRHKTFLFHKGDQSLRGEFLHVAKPDFYILYLHGGGYIAGRAATYINMVGKLCHDILANAWLLDYRLAPEHRYPSSLDDAWLAYHHLLDSGLPAKKIIVMGDSAGGGLTLALLLRLKDEGVPLPKCAAAFSPYTDLTHSSPSINQNSDSDDVLTAGLLHKGTGLYADKDQLTLPYVSPVYGDYKGLPPLCITVSESECLRDDALRVKKKAEAAGVPVTMIMRDDLPHVWPVYYPLMPEASEDLDHIASFMVTA